MTTVRILPEILSNQIAAGEVVERPASVVKELVENSIDACATDITIEVVKGGKSLIRVSDNGIGLSRDDALLSIERYATSKIFTKEDLFSISTMGFRGEALPSIASVSKFALVTRTKESDTGTRIEIVGGKIRDVTEAGAPVGTMVEVKHLFFNTPARKKFLKSDQTEISHIADVISGIALGNVHVRFRLFFNDRLYKNFSASDDLFQRSVNVLGKDVSEHLYSLKWFDDDIEITGFVANPIVTRSTSSKIFLFVNKRLIQERGLISAIFQGFKGRIMKGKYPLGVIFIQVPYDQVDVNVHPSKREIKFFNHQRIYYSLSTTIMNTLLKNQTIKSQKQSAKRNEIYKQQQPYNYQRQEDTGDNLKIKQSVMDWDTIIKPPVESNIVESNTVETIEGGGGIDANPNKNKLSILKIFGQVMGTYILAESVDGLVLIDQHAAHERIVYETLKKRFESLDVITQDLVVPETIELNHKESNVLTNLSPELRQIGINVEPFGGTTFVIKSVPSIIDQKEIKPIVLEIIEYTIENKTNFLKDNWIDECLILMACHNAVRANKKLDIRELENLVNDLLCCSNPHHCPHGRPTTVTLGKNEFNKLFKRVV